MAPASSCRGALLSSKVNPHSLAQAVNTVWDGIMEPDLDPLVSTLLEADYGAVMPAKQDGFIPLSSFLL
jgi:hypothetical protein